MIRDVVIHLLSEQPVLADLFEAPAAVDVTLLCTNLRTLDGKRPIFVDRSDSTFVFPYLHIRFLEIRPDRSAAPVGAAGTGAGETRDDPGSPAEAEDLEIDEEFLRRVRDV